MQFEPIFIVGFICYFIYLIFELFARRVERKMLIEKLDPKDLPDFAKTGYSTFISAPLSNEQSKSYRMLRLGMIFAGLGFGLLVTGLLTIFYIKEMQEEYYNYHRVLDTFVSSGCVVLSTAIFVLVGFVIEYRLRRKNAKQE